MFFSSSVTKRKLWIVRADINLQKRAGHVYLSPHLNIKGEEIFWSSCLWYLTKEMLTYARSPVNKSITHGALQTWFKRDSTALFVPLDHIRLFVVSFTFHRYYISGRTPRKLCFQRLWSCRAVQSILSSLCGYMAGSVSQRWWGANGMMQGMGWGPLS